MVRGFRGPLLGSILRSTQTRRVITLFILGETYISLVKGNIHHRAIATSHKPPSILQRFRRKIWQLSGGLPPHLAACDVAYGADAFSPKPRTLNPKNRSLGFSARVIPYKPLYRDHNAGKLCRHAPLFLGNPHLFVFQMS